MRIGIDVLQMGELDRLQNRSWFRSYVYADDELALAASFGPRRAREFLAGRFAAKEAVIKALGARCGGTHGMRPRHICVLPDAIGAPRLRLRGPAALHAATLGMPGLTVSIAHKGTYVVAVALGHDCAATAEAERKNEDAEGITRSILRQLADAR